MNKYFFALQKRCFIWGFVFLLSFLYFNGNNVRGASGSISSDGRLIEMGQLRYEFDQAGKLTSIYHTGESRELLIQNKKRALITLYIGNQYHEPSAMSYEDGLYKFAFSQGLEVGIEPKIKSGYITFEVKSIANPNNIFIKHLIWGPIPIGIKETVGDTLGVVYDEEYGIGLLGANVKTVAGWPTGLSEIIPKNGWHPTRFGASSYVAAMPIADGAQLRAHTTDFSKEWTKRYSPVYSSETYENYIADQLDEEIYGQDGEIIGSKIALYGCETEEIINLVEKIVKNEDLPYSTVKDKWSKNPENIHNTNQTVYLYDVFTEENMDEKIDEGRRVGADMLYGHDTFITYNGDYRFKGFDSYSSFKEKIADKALAKGLLVGTKSRPSFINRNTPYALGDANVSRNFKKASQSRLTKNISTTDTYIEIEQKSNFPTSYSKTVYVLVDQELMRVRGGYGGRLSVVERGDQSTTVTAHSKDTPVYRINYLDVWSGNFFGNQYHASDIMSVLADSINTAGLSLSDFDGLEASEDTGHGIYMHNKVLDLWYRRLDDSSNVKCYSSGMTQFGWHVYTNQTWGEKYAYMYTDINQFKYRTSGNYDYFTRNFFPASLGLVSMSENPSILEAHWLGSKAAAYNAGMVFSNHDATSPIPDAIKNEVLETIRQWTTARDVNAFTMEQRKDMAKYETHWKLTPIEPSISWTLEKLRKSGSNWVVDSSQMVKAPRVENLAIEAEVWTTTGQLVNVEVASTTSQAMTVASKINDNRLDGYELIGSGPQSIQMNLGKEESLDQIRLWHYYQDGRTYKDVVVQVSNDPTFTTNVTTVYNNDQDNSLGLNQSGDDEEYAETYGGLTIEFEPVMAQYVRLWSNGNNINEDNHYVEVQVIKGQRTFGGPLNKKVSQKDNIAYRKPVTVSGTPVRDPQMATDGNTESNSWMSMEEDGLGWVQVDLEESYEIDKMKVWRYYNDGRRYKDCVIQISTDSQFETGVTTVYNNDADNSSGLGQGYDEEYSEYSEGKILEFDPVIGRYIRLYTNGNSANNSNHLVEVAVYEKKEVTPPSQLLNRALNRVPTFSGTVENQKERATDGDYNTHKWVGVSELGHQWMTLDLGQQYDVEKIKLWRYYDDGRTYQDTVIQISESSDFQQGNLIVFNNDENNSLGFGQGTDATYAESSEGKTIDFTSTQARYVRIHSSGSNINGNSHWVEVEVYGK